MVIFNVLPHCLNFSDYFKLLISHLLRLLFLPLDSLLCAPSGGFCLHCMAKLSGAHRRFSSEEPLLGQFQVPLGIHLQMDQWLLHGPYGGSFLPQVLNSYDPLIRLSIAVHFFCHSNDSQFTLWGSYNVKRSQRLELNQNTLVHEGSTWQWIQLTELSLSIIYMADVQGLSCSINLYCFHMTI